jgi:hypothetical protein
VATVSADRKGEKQMDVRPVIDLEIDAAFLPLGTKGGHLAQDIQLYASKNKYIRTPSGWFVPLQDLLPRLEEVAEYLHIEALYYGEFEIGGGFEILTDEGISLGVPTSAVFYQAMKMSKTIIDLTQPQKSHRILLSSQDVWIVSLDDNNIVIQQGDAGSRTAPRWLFQSDILKERLQAAQLEVQYFAAKLEPLLLGYQNPKITSHLIQRMFGLE